MVSERGDHRTSFSHTGKMARRWLLHEANRHRVAVSAVRWFEIGQRLAELGRRIPCHDCESDAWLYPVPPWPFDECPRFRDDTDFRKQGIQHRVGISESPTHSSPSQEESGSFPSDPEGTDRHQPISVPEIRFTKHRATFTYGTIVSSKLRSAIKDLTDHLEL